MESSFTPAQKIVGIVVLGLTGYGLYKLATMDSKPPAKKLNGVRRKKRKAK